MASHATRQPEPPQTPTQPPVDGEEQYDDDTTTPVQPSQPTDG